MTKLSHRTEHAIQRARTAYVPVPFEVAQVQIDNMEKAQDRYREQMLALLKGNKPCVAAQFHAQSLTYGDLTELQYKTLMGLTEPKMKAGQVEEAAGLSPTQARSPLMALVAKGYAKVGWNRGVRIWTRTDKPAPVNEKEQKS